MARQTTTTRRRTARRSTRSAPRRSSRSGPRSTRTRSTSTRRASRPGSAAGNGDQDRGIQRFLEGFTAALTSGDGRAAAECFEYPSLMVMSAVGGYGGTQPIGSAEEAEAFFDRAPEQYHAKGIEETFPDVEDVQWVSHDLALVRAHFPYIDRDGNDMGDGETSLYVVRKDGEGHRICAAVTLGTDGDRAAR